MRLKSSYLLVFTYSLHHCFEIVTSFVSMGGGNVGRPESKRSIIHLKVFSLPTSDLTTGSGFDCSLLRPLAACFSAQKITLSPCICCHCPLHSKFDLETVRPKIHIRTGFFFSEKVLTFSFLNLKFFFLLYETSTRARK
jgi:hypothetical protein